MMWIIVAVVPYGLLISETEMNLNWVTYTTQCLTAPFLIPIFLSVTWVKNNRTWCCRRLENEIKYVN